MLSVPSTTCNLLVSQSCLSPCWHIVPPSGDGRSWDEFNYMAFVLINFSQPFLASPQIRQTPTNGAGGKSLSCILSVWQMGFHSNTNFSLLISGRELGGEWCACRKSCCRFCLVIMAKGLKITCCVSLPFVLILTLICIRLQDTARQ